MSKAFDEAFLEALKMTPEELEKVPIDPFVEEAFRVFAEMQDIAQMEDEELNPDAGISQQS